MRIHPGAEHQFLHLAGGEACRKLVVGLRDGDVLRQQAQAREDQDQGTNDKDTITSVHSLALLRIIKHETNHLY